MNINDSSFSHVFFYPSVFFHLPLGHGFGASGLQACGLQGPQRFLVDNSSLRSDSSGLRYRSSPDGEKNRVPRQLWTSVDVGDIEIIGIIGIM